MSFSPFVFQHLLEMLNVIASARQERASQGLTEGRVVILYEDFSLKIEPQRGNVYPVIVLRSPAGEGRGSFRLPFNPDDIGDMLFDLARTVRGSGRAPLRDAAPGATRTLPQQIGDQLFGALFSGSVRSLFDRSLGMIHGRERGLRIKLHIDPEDASLAKLAGLPWEFMYRKETRDFLGLSRSTPIVRYLDVQRPCVPLPLELPLRILVVISSPTNYRQLDLDEERQRIEASWAKQAGVQVEFLQPATRTALRDRLAEVEQPYHVVHYMGHGGFSQHSGRGVLILEEEDGLGDPVDGSTLGILLRDMPSLRLVFLNACETARVTKQEGLDPFAGVAAALVMAGVPAVVAMQFPITDQAAVTFAQRFYPLLARGQPVDMAVAEGRRAVRLAESETMEWATPVLFMRAPEGVLFETKEPQPAARPLPKLPDIDEELEQRLEQLYTAGLSAFWLGEWEKATPYFQAIVDVRPDYEDAAAKLVASQRQAKLKDLYERAQAARADEEWQAALTALEELVSHTPDYKDAAALLEATKRQKQLADLYGEAQRLSQAEKWQAVVNVFARIAALDPHYPDPDALLPTAEAAFAEQQRQEELKGLHGRALRAMNAGQWTAARALLTQLQEMEPGYGDAERLLAKVEEEISRAEAERQRQEQIAVLYKEAQELAVAGEWQQILATVQEIQKLDPDYADLEGLAAQAQAEVQRQERLEQLYTEAEAAEKVEDWGGAIAALESLLDEDADFRNAAVLLARAREQQRLDELYLEAQQHYEAGRWQDVVDTFAQITTIEPNYPDPDRLLDSARQEMAIQKRQAELDALYHHATQAMEAGQWEQARQLLDQIQEQEPGFRQTEQLLAQAEDEIKGAEAEQRRQEQAATLYEQAQGLVRAKQWRGALGKMEALETLAPDFGDPEGIAGTAQEELAHEEEEARRQHELATLYAEAVHLLKAEHYQEALEKWREVQALDPRYPDRRRVQATARKKLDSLARPAARRRLPTWTIPAIGGLVLIALIVAGVLLGDRPGGGAPEAPAASQPTATAKPDTETPTRTARPTMATATTGFPAFVSDVLPDAELVYHDDFDQLRSWEWGYEGVYVEASDGLAVIVGKPSHSWLESKRSLSEGEGVLVLFKYDAGSGCWFSLYSGVWRTSSWRVWHIGCDLYPWFDQGWAGGGSEGPLIGDLKSNPNTWYYVLLAVGADGEIVAQVWERDDPDQKARYRRAFGEDWAGQTWQFSIAVSEGMAYVDSFTQISFGEILGTWTSGKAPEAPLAVIQPSNEWVKHPSNPVLEVDEPGSWDESWVIMPSVIKDGGNYMMWYRGVDADGQRRIGLAASKDGVDWVKDERNPVLVPGTPGDWDDGQIESARVLKDGDTYKMWYTGVDGSGTARIGFATSDDGIGWTKHPGNPVLDRGNSGEWDAQSVRGAWVVQDGSLYEMWYSGENGDGVLQLGYATSSDGVNWTKYDTNPVLTPGVSGAWDDRGVLYPSVVKRGTTYWLWYMGTGDETFDRIGYATSPDGISWTKYGDNPVLQEAAAGDWDDAGTACPAVILDGNTFKMWFQGWRGTPDSIRIGYATSASDMVIVEYQQGLNLLEKGGYEQAIASFDQVMALGWEDAELYYQRGRACRQWLSHEGGCSLEQAIADLTQAIKLNSQNADYWNERGWSHSQQGNYTAATDDFDMAIELNPQDCSAYWGRGLTHRGQGEYENAIRDLGKAIELCHDIGGLYVDRGWIYYEQLGDSTLALSDFSMAVEVQPNEPDFYFQRGYAYERLGQVTEARTDYEKYLELTEGDPNADWRDQVQQWLAEHANGPRPTPTLTPEAPGTYLDRALAGEFEGTAVRVLGYWALDEANKFKASVADFEDETGIDIQYQTSTDTDAAVATGMFDIVGFSNPGMLTTYARQGQVVDVSTFLPQSSLDNYDQSWWDMATMEGPDGQDITAGVWHHFSSKSLVWYPKSDFEAAGYEIPNTWEEMLALSDQIVADGGTPWCIGIESDWATGWPATDWIEDILLRTTSLENYDRWVAGELPFDSPEVRHAAEVMSDIWFNDDYVYGGRDYIVNTFFGEAFNPMFEDPPKCWLHRQANFITSFFPPGVEAGRDYDFFYLPPIDPTYGKPYLITADIMAMFNDRDEVRAVMEYLTKGESTKGWLAAGGALAPHKDARLGWYGDRVERRIAEVSFGATSFRFDGSDLMPGQVGAGSFWKGMTDWVSGAADIDTVVKEIDATWPR